MKFDEVLGPEDTDLGDDARDEVCWGNVEGRIPALYASRCNSLVTQVCHFTVGPLLDGYVITTRNSEVNGGLGGCHVEGDSVMLSDDCNLDF